MNIEQIAKVCHEVNRSYCKCMGFKVLPAWEEVSDHIKQSCLDGVKYHIENQDSKPSDSHNNWMKFKLADGWIYGEVRDDLKKIHPCLVPYEQLPKEEQAKDFIFMTIVRELEALNG